MHSVYLGIQYAPKLPKSININYTFKDVGTDN